MATQSKAFKDSVVASRKLKAKPTDDELLQLYALYKQTLQDPPIAQSETPGTFDFKGKAKKRAWQKLVEDEVTPEQAMSKYVTLVNELKEKYGYEA